LASGRVKEATLGTTQGNLGLKGHASDQSNGGCTVIALLIVSACLVNIESSFVIEKIIDIFCQTPLQRIRERFYHDQGFVHVNADQALDELCALGLLERPDVSFQLFSLHVFVIPLYVLFSQVKAASCATDSLETFSKTKVLFNDLFPCS